MPVPETVAWAQDTPRDHRDDDEMVCVTPAEITAACAAACRQVTVLPTPVTVRVPPCPARSCESSTVVLRRRCKTTADATWVRMAGGVKGQRVEMCRTKTGRIVE